MNWFWKMNLLDSRLTTVAPASLVTAKQMIPTLTNFNTLNIYSYSDAALYGNTIQHELAIDDPADANAVLAASRAGCRFMALTLTFSPQQVIP